MKALSLIQPYLNNIIAGVKKIETRNWSTNYRGDLLLCASGSVPIEPYGKALCVVKLLDCRKMVKTDEADACCEWNDQKYAWIISDLRMIEPFEQKGRGGLFDVRDEKIVFKQQETG
jgi:hypothetical protein